MMGFLHVILACGIVYAGAKLVASHRVTTGRSWLAAATPPRPQSVRSVSTRLWIIRAWPESQSRAHETVFRYTLDNPTAETRRGYVEVDALLEQLKIELTPPPSQTPRRDGPGSPRPSGQKPV